MCAIQCQFVSLPISIYSIKTDHYPSSQLIYLDMLISPPFEQLVVTVNLSHPGVCCWIYLVPRHKQDLILLFCTLSISMSDRVAEGARLLVTNPKVTLMEEYSGVPFLVANIVLCQLSLVACTLKVLPTPQRYVRASPSIYDWKTSYHMSDMTVCCLPGKLFIPYRSTQIMVCIIFPPPSPTMVPRRKWLILDLNNLTFGSACHLIHPITAHKIPPAILVKILGFMAHVSFYKVIFSKVIPTPIPRWSSTRVNVHDCRGLGYVPARDSVHEAKGIF